MSDDWARLCELLDDDPEVRRAVVQAADEPQAFLAEHEQVLGELGVADASQIDPWLALIDAIDDAGALAYLEPDDTGEELADALSGLPRVIAAGVDVDAVSDVDGSQREAIAVADGLLAPHGLRVVYLDEGTEDVPLVVVPIANAREIVQLAERLGHTASVFA